MYMLQGISVIRHFMKYLDKLGITCNPWPFWGIPEIPKMTRNSLKNNTKITQIPWPVKYGNHYILKIFYDKNTFKARLKQISNILFLLKIKHFLHLNEYLYTNRNLILMQGTRTRNKHMLQFIIIENLVYFGEKSLFSQTFYIFNQSLIMF